MNKTLIVRNGKLRPAAVFAMLLVPVLMGVVCIGIGRMSLPAEELIETLVAALMGGEVSSKNYSVLFNIRLPRIFMAIIVGAGLTTAGAAYQALFSNPLATPDILGVTSGSCVGAVIAILLSMGMVEIQLLSLAFGLLSVWITMSLARGRQGGSVVFLVLSGVIISSLFNAVASLLKYTADPMDKLPAISYWLMGSFTGASYKKLMIGSPLILAGIIVIYLLRWQLNLLSLSDDEARASGIDLRRMRLVFIVAATAISASAVSMCGQVGWIGLLIPHCARLIAGSNNRYVIPLSISLGAGFMILIDTLSRSLSVIELPLSVLTAIIGAPVFISLLKKSGMGMS